MSSVTNSGTNCYYCAAPGAHQTIGKEEGMENAACRVLCISVEKESSIGEKKVAWTFSPRYKHQFFEESESLFFAFYGWEATTEHPFPELFDYNNFKESRKVTVQNYFMFHLKILVHFARINVSEWSSFFSTFSHGPLGCKIILNFKMTKVLDEGTINYTTIYNGIITFL